MRLDIPDNFDIAPLMAAISDTAKRQAYRTLIAFDRALGEGVIAFKPETVEPSLQLPLNPNVIPITQARAARGVSADPMFTSPAA